MVGMTNGLIQAFRLKYLDNKGNEHDPRQARSRSGATTRGRRSRRGPCRPRASSPSAGATTRSGSSWPTSRRCSTGSRPAGRSARGSAGYGTRTLLIPSADKILYAVDLFTSRMLWTLRLRGTDHPGAAGRRRGDLRDQHGRRLLQRRPGDRPAASGPIPTQGGRLVAITPTQDLPPVVQPRPVRGRPGDRQDGGRPGGQSHLRAGLNLREYDLNIVNRFNDRLYFAHRLGPDPGDPRDRAAAAQAAAQTRRSRRSATSRRTGSRSSPRRRPRDGAPRPRRAAAQGPARGRHEAGDRRMPPLPAFGLKPEAAKKEPE